MLTQQLPSLYISAFSNCIRKGFPSPFSICFRKFRKRLFPFFTSSKNPLFISDLTPFFSCHQHNTLNSITRFPQNLLLICFLYYYHSIIQTLSTRQEGLLKCQSPYHLSANQLYCNQFLSIQIFLLYTLKL